MSHKPHFKNYLFFISGILVAIVISSIVLAWREPTVNPPERAGETGMVFVKCQVKHSPTPVYPECPPGWKDVYHYPMAPVTSGSVQEPTTPTGVSVGMDNMNTEDNSWWYAAEWTEDPPGSGVFKKVSTLSCTVCRRE